MVENREKPADENAEFLETLCLLEPAAQAVTGSATALTSIAISLKRIADALENPAMVEALSNIEMNLRRER